MGRVNIRTKGESESTDVRISIISLRYSSLDFEYNQHSLNQPQKNQYVKKKKIK